MNIISRYSSLVKFGHTLFAMPFAMMGYAWGIKDSGGGFDWLLLLKVILAMVFARNMAMGFNRYLDRDIDARNRRTAGREIPAGKISAHNALWFTIVNGILFLAAALWINRLCFYLAPVALIVLLGYSYTKRFTAWCHVVLGCALAIAPTGAYAAVTGSFAMVPLLLSVLVLTWTAGFDIIYSLQDIEFDRKEGLHSVPARLGIRGSLVISAVLHLVSLYAVWLVGIYMNASTWYWTGAGIFALMLFIQHISARPSRISRIDSSFGTINGIASLCYAAFAISDIFIGG